jgi:DNA-binding response OmpR family regulator
MSEIKILLVDDDKSILDLYDRGLGTDIFEKRFAGTGKEAIEVYHEWRPDVIVLDIIMPVMTGFAVLQEIRSNDKSTMVIMATSLSTSQDVRDCVKMGIQGYIIKPFLPKEIANRIMHCIQKDTPAPQ